MRVLAIGCLAILAACMRTEEEPATDTAAGTAAPAATTRIALGDVAGTWTMTSTPVSGTDTSRTTYVLTAAADSAGWTMKFPQRPDPVPVRIVAVDGDSIVTESGPFASVRRQGVQVTTRSVLRHSGDRLVGTTRARYVTSGADTVLNLRTEGTRTP